MNLDCQYYDVELEISPQEGQTLTLLCEHCHIGQAQMRLSEPFHSEYSNEEMTEAEFDIRKIFNF